MTSQWSIKTFNILISRPGEDGKLITGCKAQIKLWSFEYNFCMCLFMHNERKGKLASMWFIIDYDKLKAAEVINNFILEEYLY